GWVRAFLKTVWLVTSDSKSLRMETAKAQSLRDAARFRRWVAIVLSACFVAAVALIVREGGIRELAVRPPSQSGMMWRMPGWEQDLLVPWSAGIVLWPALFSYPVLLGFYVACAPASVFRTRGMADDYAEAVRSIGRYVAAPLFLVLPAAMASAAAIWLIRNAEVFTRTMAVVPMIAVGIYALRFVALAGTLYRTGQWRARTTDHA